MPRTPLTTAGSPAHHELMRKAALARHARRRAEGIASSDSRGKSPTILPRAPRARDDQRKFSDKPGPSTLAAGPSMAELTEWRRARTRSGV